MRSGQPILAWRHLPQLGDLAGPALPSPGLSMYPGNAAASPREPGACQL